MGGDGEWSRMWEVFHGAVELDGASRATYLAQCCAGDAGLRSRLERLLAAHGRASRFLEPGERPSAFTFEAVSLRDGTPSRVGHYVLRETIGQGGFAEVFLATQTEPVRRDVALKLLRPDMSAGRVIERFEAERQTLAALHHPNIATIFDAGVAENGRPYFVMEYIAGRRITAYCEERGLDLHARLALFADVCRAVQHAHHKGVIHRDLKPSNVLVTEVDGKPVVKVIDFGIARAIDRAAGPGDAETLAGTPGYMSPEQAETGDVDTRTDVFSLGVMLYELVTEIPVRAGVATALSRRAPMERIRGIVHPSELVRAISGREGRVCGLDPRALRGDLGAILTKSLEPDRALRYGSPAELAADLDRFVHHLPVSAGPSSWPYQARKFVRRHQVGVGMAAVLVLLAVAGVLHLADTARTERRLRAAAVTAQTAAERDARIARAVNEFLTMDIIGAGDPRVAVTPDILLRDAIDAAEAKIGERFKGDPVVEAAVRHTVGVTYRSLGKFDPAAANLERAVALFQTQGLGEDARGLNAEDDLAHLYTRMGRMADAEAILRRVIDVRLRRFGPEAEGTLASRSNLGVLYSDTGRDADAERELSACVGSMRRVLGPDAPGTMLVTQHLGLTYLRMMRYADAEPLLRSSMEYGRSARGRDHPYTIAATGNLAQALMQQGRAGEAEPLYMEIVGASERRLGPDHVETGAARAGLADFYIKSRRYADAEPLMLAALAKFREVFGDEHVNTLSLLSSTCSMYDLWERPADGEPFGALAADGARRVMPETHRRRGLYLMTHGTCLKNLGRHADAEPRLVEALRILEATVGVQHAHTRGALRGLAEVCDGLGRPEEAQKYRALLAESEAQQPASK